MTAEMKWQKTHIVNKIKLNYKVSFKNRLNAHPFAAGMFLCSVYETYYEEKRPSTNKTMNTT